MRPVAYGDRAGKRRSGRDMHALADAAVMIDARSRVDDAVCANHRLALDDRAGHDLNAIGKAYAGADDGGGMNDACKAKAALAAAPKDGIAASHGGDRSDPIYQQDLVWLERIQDLVTPEHRCSTGSVRGGRERRVDNAHDAASIRAHRLDQHPRMAAAAEHEERQLDVMRGRSHAYG